MSITKYWAFNIHKNRHWCRIQSPPRESGVRWTSLLRQHQDIRSSASLGNFLELFLTCVVPSGSYAGELWTFQDLGLMLGPLWLFSSPLFISNCFRLCSEQKAVVMVIPYCWALWCLRYGYINVPSVGGCGRLSLAGLALST